MRHKYYTFPYDTNYQRMESLGEQIEEYESMGFEFIQALNRGATNIIYLLFKKTYKNGTSKRDRRRDVSAIPENG